MKFRKLLARLDSDMSSMSSWPNRFQLVLIVVAVGVVVVVVPSYIWSDILSIFTAKIELLKTLLSLWWYGIDAPSEVHQGTRASLRYFVEQCYGC